MNSNKEQMNDNAPINPQAEQPVFSFGVPINPQVDGCFGFSAGGFPINQQSSGFSFSATVFGGPPANFNFGGSPTAFGGSWDQQAQQNFSKLSYFETLCNQSKKEIKSFRCPDHYNNNRMVVDGYILDCCNDSHTTLCKETAIYNLIEQLHNICDINDELVEKHDNYKQTLLKIISKYRQRLSDLNRKINDNKNEPKKDIEEAEPVNKKTKL